jgi:hypothetical protein
MTVGVVASPEKVAMMVRVLDAHCHYAGIPSHAAEREDIAAKLPSTTISDSLSS